MEEFDTEIHDFEGTFMGRRKAGYDAAAGEAALLYPLPL